MANTRKKYRVLRGLDWGKNERAEADDVRDDIPAASIPWLLEDGLIEPVEEPKPKSKSKPAASGGSKPAADAEEVA